MSPKSGVWSSERVELMKSCFHAGLSCSQIAHEIGVSRNAVIGKMNRLGLSRSKEGPQRGRAKQARPKAPGAWRQWAPRPRRVCSPQMLTESLAEPQPQARDVPLGTGPGCTLFELRDGRCRWPISSAGSQEFCFCGKETVEGLPYCLGHARMAYRP